MADLFQGRSPLADRSNCPSSPAFSTRRKKLRACHEDTNPDRETNDANSGCSIVGTQESRLDSGKLKPGLFTLRNGGHNICPEVQSKALHSENSGQAASHLKETPQPRSTSKFRDSSDEIGRVELHRDERHAIATSSSNKKRPQDVGAERSSDNEIMSTDVAPNSVSNVQNIEGTPAKRIPVASGNEFLTPQNLVPGIGEARFSGSGSPQSEGRVIVYEHRNRLRQYERSLYKSCPQFRTLSSTEMRRPQLKDRCSLHLLNARNKPRRGKSTRESEASGETSESNRTQTSYDPVLEQVYSEGRAFFAEVDAFELQEEEEEEGDAEEKP